MSFPVRFAFTRLELTVAIGTMGLVLGLAVSGVVRARAAADRVHCADRLKNLAGAMHRYEHAYHGLPPRRITTPVHHGWGAVILPFLGEEALARAYHLDQNFYDPKNQPVIRVHLAAFQCPDAPPNREMTIVDMGAGDTKAIGGCSDYAVIHTPDDPGVPAHLHNNRRAALADNQVMPRSAITDGESQTMLITEQAGRPDYWLKGVKQPTAAGLTLADWWGAWAAYNAFALRTYSDDGKKEGGPCVLNCSNSLGIYAFHKEGANAAFVDGSVRMLKPTIDRYVLFALITRDGGEPLRDGDF